MPRYHFDSALNSWVKECSCCHEVTVGKKDLKDSIVIFAEMFSESNGSAAGMADNFQSRCWICNSAKRRELNITRPQIEAMMKVQDGHCVICDWKLSIARNALQADKANVDHDKESGQIRALLCGNCNRGIGLMLHDSDTLHRAADYCNHHNKIIKFRCV